MPIGKRLRGPPLQDWAVSLLNPADFEAFGLNSKVVADVWQEHQTGMDRQAMLWTVLMYHKWHQRVMKI